MSAWPADASAHTDKLDKHRAVTVEDRVKLSHCYLDLCFPGQEIYRARHSESWHLERWDECSCGPSRSKNIPSKGTSCAKALGSTGLQHTEHGVAPNLAGEANQGQTTHMTSGLCY